MPTTAARRPLRFATLDEVMPEVDRLIDRGHTTVGKWTLAQICNHLAGALVLSTREIPFKGPWLLRKTIAPFFLRRMLRTGRMPEGFKIPASALPKPGLDARAEAETLRTALRRYAAHTGRMSEHPFFGAVGRDGWDRIHLIHCAHHLSFALPVEAP